MESRKRQVWTPLWLQVIFFAIIIAATGFALAAAISETGLLSQVHKTTCKYVFTEEPQSSQP
uniref:Uncharacterized protein n=1 Tax=Leviviridae sp. TaxID=2027243 RepID=A0A514D063_9VIRU|nr:MAG: hypothetical protein H2RhizoLitter491507_000002 [Leviviridae sp.]